MEDPYLLADANDLRSIGHNLRLMNKYFKMVNDIDLEKSTYFPIADGGYPFTGRFDGNNHSISNLSYTIEYKNKVGAIAHLGENGQIRNVGLLNVQINAGDQSDEVGGLIGYNEAGIVSECYASGFIQGGDDVGLLIGINENGIISNCYSVGEVEGLSPVGGLIGYNYHGTVSNCYAVVKISGTLLAGVLVGRSSSASYNSCFWHNGLNEAIQGTSQTGVTGIFGRTDEKMWLEDTFTSAGWDFSGETTNGNEDIWAMPSCGYPIFTWQSAATIPSVYGEPLETAEYLLKTRGLKIYKTLRGYSNNIQVGSVIESLPRSSSEVADSLPIYLVVSAGPCPYDGGTGIKDNPCRISNLSQLQILNETTIDYDLCFLLTNDIDLTGFTYSRALIAPDVCDTTSFFEGTLFRGNFNGGGHRISGLTINSSVSGIKYLGLFGGVGCNGRISNLYLDDVNVLAPSNSMYVGTIAGSIKLGAIENCKVSGSITGSGTIGGLIGENLKGIVTKTTVDTSVLATGYYVGGLVGSNQGILSQCSAYGNIAGKRYVGGLCGKSGGNISNSYAIGNITNVAYSGGLVGYNLFTNFENCLAVCSGGRGLIGHEEWYSSPIYTSCFWDKTINPAVGLGNKPDPAGMIGVTTTLMKTKSTFTNAGWDFDTPVWIIEEGIDYPQLWWESANQIPVAVAWPNQTVYAGIDGIVNVNLDGGGSYDPDGDQLSYLWSWLINGNTFEANDISPTIELPVGKHVIRLVVNDGIDDSEPDELVINVLALEPAELMDGLSEDVFDLDLPEGISNSLQMKLDSATQVLEDENEHNDVAAINSLKAFTNAVEAQCGKKISEEDAGYLITAAQQIINILSSE